MGTELNLSQDKARVSPSWENYYRKERGCMEELERCHALLDEIDRVTQQLIGRAGLPALHFYMEEGSVQRAASGHFGKHMGGYFLYSAMDGEEEAYIICTDIREAGDGEWKADGSLFRLTEEKLESYDFAAGEWESPETLACLYTAMRTNAPENDFLWAKARHTDTYPFSSGLEEQLGSLKKYKSLTRLYADVQKIAAFGLLEKDDGSLLPALFPADPVRKGSVVWWTGSQGGLYCLGNLLPDDGEHLENPKYGNDVLSAVWTTPDKEEILAVIRWMWDHYSGGCPVYQYPLSSGAYAESGSPGEEDFVLHYRFGVEELEEGEISEFQRIREAFCSRQDTEETKEENHDNGEDD